MFHTSKEIAGARSDDQTKLVRFQKWNMTDMGSINKSFQIMKEIKKKQAKMPNYTCIKVSSNW